MEETNKGTYNQARKEILDRYRENHREKINAYAIEWYKKKMDSSPEFVEKKREAAMRRYYKKKQEMIDLGLVKEPKKRGRKPKYFVVAAEEDLGKK